MFSQWLKGEKHIRFFGRMRGYNLKIFLKDLEAGTIVGIVAIPLALAFAIASGVKPAFGIYTAIISGILVAVFGGSSVQIAGPTGAFVPVLFGIITIYGYDNLLLAGFLSGVMLVVMGIAKAGKLIKFIPRPVTVGFTAGIAVVVFSGQIDSFLGLTGVKKHEFLLGSMIDIWQHLTTVNIYSIIIASFCLLLLLFSHRLIPALPGPIVGIAVATIVATLFFNGRVDTLGSKFGGLPSTMPAIHMLRFSLLDVRNMIGPAFAIAVLGSIESLLSCVVADGMSGKQHDSNRELIGQGIANLVVPFFGGIAATGAIARTATNVRNGGTTPVAAMVHSLVLIAFVLIFAPLVSLIPLASMAPVLMLVAWNMFDRREFAHLLRTTRGDSFVLITTFLLTVFTTLTTAVEIGLLMAAALFIDRMAKLVSIEKVLPDYKGGKKVTPQIVTPLHDCPQISIFTIDGALFFGAAQVFEKTLLESIHARPKVLILRVSTVPMLDATAEAGLKSIVNRFQKQKGIIIIAGLKEQPEIVMKKSGLYDKIGSENYFEGTGAAINHALGKIDRSKCIGCAQKAFFECAGLSEPIRTGLPKESRC